MITSRERVMTAVNHQQPDRIPIDLGGHRSSGIMAIAYNNLKQYLGIRTGDIYVYDFIQQLAIVEPEVLDYFEVDTVELGRGFALKQEDWHDWVLPDGTACKIPAYIHPLKAEDGWHVYHEDGTLLAIQKESALWFDQTHWPLATSDDPSSHDLASALERVMWVALDTPPVLDLDEEGLKELAAGAKALRESTDRAILGIFGGSIYELSQYLLGMANFYMLLASEPARAHRLLNRLVEMHLQNLERFLSAVGPNIDIIVFGGDDLGMQSGPQISPHMFEEFFLSRYRLMWAATKRLADVKIMLHSCGGICPFLPGLIEAGLDIIQPVQTTAKDMEPETLKREFGKDLCLWGGGCNTQSILPRGTPAEVAEDVRRRLGIFAPGGGYVFQQIHNILAEVRPENIVAMFEAVNSQRISS